MTTNLLLNLAFVLLAYLAGSVSAAIITCRLLGLPDPRSQGSKNPGATNVMRIGGKKAALITLAGDSIKGVIPVLLAQAFGVDGLWLAAVALAAFLGHLFPIFFGFEGGKGVATGFGVIFALEWRLGLCLGAVWLIMAVLFRYSSLAALTAFAAAPVIAWFYWPAYTLPLAILSALLIWRHQENIRKLISGQESKIGQKKVAQS
ncbi:glycerol-3-phosphate 1-O-acyltransferase PlsY [Permianibacter sp. IMCC34836]|uniref:glycerol-3-phosphate 1-O-acyltransferase PlsY n=1 Tax=Permianibacter fluminis TaxID=2738515 RepID=UPI001552392D|nr:glycerol-3-phosphate 1-O-acyltransferase PlsY [Permianibacter fluminis]NQD36404.1 glycerol-3-phosphate 1-O-acyltransferase PlsY [Permianibacter fluminis]